MAGEAARGRQWMQETSEDRETRRIGDFATFEAAMPFLDRSYSGSLQDKVTSYLGSRNPFYKTVAPEDHLVWLFDNTAFRSSRFSSSWEAEFVACYFVKNSGKDVSRIAADIAEKLGLGRGDVAEATIARRLQPFADQILPAHSVNIDIANNEVHRLGPSSRDGISSDIIKLNGKYKEGQPVACDALGVSAKEMTTFFAGPKGWAVLSDVDDTIKRTLTSSPVGILRTTFVDEPEPISGMPELYRHIHKKLEAPPFWYLSASPYNLYPFLKTFREKFYPPGQMILREASWMNLAGLFVNLTQGTEAYKVDRMEKVHSWFPKRRFVLIGDSTQTDPESYGEMYRRYPKWVGAIFIRKVTGVAEMDESRKNSDERFEKAFKDVPRDVWYVFQDPRELYAKVDALVR